MIKLKLTLPLRCIFLVAICINCSAQKYSYPIKKSTDGRYLVDQNNKPFPILGRTAWFLISQPANKYRKFIENTLSHGYNSIEISVLTHDARGEHPPFNGNGEFPFLKTLSGTDWNGSLVYSDTAKEAPDITTPNEPFWKYVDTLLSYCMSKNILVFFFPAYVGYNGNEQGWMQELVANGPDKSKMYGQWIANRYKNQKNIVWMLLGDMGRGFSPEQKAAEAGLIEGLKSVKGQSVEYSAEGSSGQNATDTDFGYAMTINGVYTWTPSEMNVPLLARNAYSHRPVMPAFLLEEPYDQEGPDGNNVNPSATQPVRRFQWWGWLSSVGGYIAGNGYIWPFNTNVWEKHLDTRATFDMERLNKFIQTYTWWKLVPSGLEGMNTLISGKNNPSDSNYVAAAATPDGTLLIAYIPPHHKGNITIDMTALGGLSNAQWYDPASGEYRKVPGAPFRNSGLVTFKPPGKNKAGETDWVLVVESSSKHEQNPGAPSAAIDIKAIDGLQFDIVRFTVKPGTMVTMTLTNVSDMGHNLIITKPGKRLDVVNAALQLAGKGPEKNYIPDDKSVLWSIPVLSEGQKAEISFRAPDDGGAYPYVCTYPGHGFVMYGVMYVNNENKMPDVTTDTNIPESRRKENTTALKDSGHTRHVSITSPHPYALTPPYLYHVFLPGASPAAIAVNLPGNISYCWDAGTCSMRFAWKGGFIDMADIWKGHFDASAKILGDIFFIDKTVNPIRIGKSGSVPAVEYKGYKLVNRYPEFHYTIDGNDVYEIVHPESDGNGLIREFKIPNAKGVIWFYVGNEDDAMKYKFSAGKFSDNKLMLTAAEAKKFTITMKSYHLLYKRRINE